MFGRQAAIPETERAWQAFRNILCLSLLLIFCMYLRTLFQQPFADDETYLAYTNRFLRGAPWNELHRLFLEPANPWEFLPLRDFTYWLDFRLYGDEFVGFHVSNLIWYALSIAGVFCFLREIALFCHPDLGKRASLFSLAGTLLFAAHPAHVEAAAWVASRKDLIAGTLVFFSLALLAHARRNGKQREILLSAALLFAAYFGKAAATACVIVASALLCASWRTSPGKNTAEKLGNLLPFWLLTGLACFIHLKVGTGTGGIHIENAPGLWAMIERASRILGALSGILVFPYPMRFYYDVYSFGGWHWFISALAVILSGVSLYTLVKKPSLWAFGVILFFAPMAIYLQFAPFSTWSLASERFVFVPVAGLSLLLIELLGRMIKPAAIGALLLALILPCALITWQRIGEWEEGQDMFEIEHRYQPHFHSVVMNLSIQLMSEKRYDEALKRAKRSSDAHAAEIMTRMIEADLAFEPFRKFQSAKALSNIPDYSRKDKATLRVEFCGAFARLQESILKGSKHIKTAPDISYSYVLNSIKILQGIRLDHQKRLCATTWNP